MRSSGPLREVSPFLQRNDSPAAVSVRINEPMWHAGERSELLVHCVQLHVLLEREAAAASGSELSLDEICARSHRVRSLLDGLGTACQALEPGAPPLTVLEETGLTRMCPLVAHVLGDANESYRDSSVPLPSDYLDHITAVNQLACTARQLRQDVLDGQYKYTAHKIALLYHAVNLSKVKRDPLRRRIEEHFDDIKVATEAAEVPELDPELAGWVVELCDEILEIVREVPPSVVARLEPLMPLLVPPQTTQSGRGSFG